MNVADERALMEDALDNYRKLLDTIPDDMFTVTPPAGGWSFAEVYSHILQASLLSAMALERCTVSTKISTKGPNLLGRLVLLFGHFPPVKIKVPPSLTEKMPPQKLSKEDARNLIIKCRKRMDGLAIALHNSAKNTRVKHPRLGMLNAGQWYKFIRIHLNHHLKQIGRIKKNFAQH